MKTIITILLIITAATQSSAQVLISEFLFNSNPVTRANVGPNAISVSSSAGSSAGGMNGTNGLNAKATGDKADVNLTIPGSPTFDVAGIDISVSFRRSEAVAYFFTRGNSMNFGMTDGYLGVTYRVSNGSGGFNTVNSGNVYAIPADDIFRTYRFVYNPSTGAAAMMVDGVSVWTNNGPSQRNLYWTGSGNVVVGQMMDGNGFSKTILDNLRIYSIVNTALPIELISFNAVTDLTNNTVNLVWATASEKNNDYFTIERSVDGKQWNVITTVQGAGNSSQELTYSIVDSNPEDGIQYYRLKQTDFDGKYEYSDLVSVQLNKAGQTKMLNVYPNPATSAVNVAIDRSLFGGHMQIKITNAMGSVVLEETNVSDFTKGLDISGLNNGNYMVEVISGTSVARTILIKN